MSAYENGRFTQDPPRYARDVCINLQARSGAQSGGLKLAASHAPAYFDLVPWSTSFVSSATQVVLEGSANDAPGLIPGYYVPYIAYGSIASTAAAHIAPVLLDNIPEQSPPYRFIFTGGQSGCSLLLLRSATVGCVAAFHYPNSDGKAKGYPLLAQVGRSASDILLAIDYACYGDEQNVNGASFFWHNGTEWVGVTQSQVMGAPDLRWGRHSMSINASRGAILISKKAIGRIT
ncbi:MAG TPA: hypothetical protein VE057_16900 [Archangium sp.]|nr:hypothetical protein [Archangium sp.]